MIFDPTINLGNILTFFGFVVGGLGIVLAMRHQINTLVSDMKAVQNEIKKMTEILVELGRQDERMSALDRRIDDLQHGRGFVLDGLPRAIRAGE